MGKPYSPNQLLTVANFFETKAIFSLAQSLEEVTLNSSGYWLMVELVRLTKCRKPTLEQWNNWMNANQTVIGPMIDALWGAMPNDQCISTKIQSGVAYITSTSEVPTEQLEVSHQAILSASAPIPQLWLWVGKVIKGRVYEPAVAQDAWLAEAFHWMFYHLNKTEQAKFNVYVVDFIKKNKANIDKIRASFSQTPKKLGTGSDGVAYDIGEEKVLKIFKDRSAFLTAVQAIERLHKQPQIAKTEAMIYDTGFIGKLEVSEYSSYDMYYLVMEKMTPILSYPGIDSEVSKILKFVASYIKRSEEVFLDLKEQMSYPEQHGQVKRKVIRLANRIAASLMANSGSLLDKIEEKIPALRENWLSSYIEEIMMKYLTGRGDLHMGNLGVTNYGDLRYYDPSHDNWKSSINARTNTHSDDYPQRNTKQMTNESENDTLLRGY